MKKKSEKKEKESSRKKVEQTKAKLTDWKTLKQIDYLQSTGFPRSLNFLRLNLGFVVDVSVDSDARVKLFKCCDCDYRSPRRDNIKTHVLRHRGVNPYVCLLCEYRTNSKSNLNCHARHVHCDERRFSCAICGKGYKSRHNMLKHSLSHA